jgi:hypothetical protein
MNTIGNALEKQRSGASRLAPDQVINKDGWTGFEVVLLVIWYGALIAWLVLFFSMG